MNPVNGKEKTIYKFGEFELILKERMLLNAGKQVPLPPKAFDVLLVLVENAGELIAKNDLMQAVWPDSFVEEGNIQVHLSAIRKALNEKPNHRFIQTVPKVGYRFTFPVQSVRTLGISKAVAAEAMSDSSATSGQAGRNFRRSSMLLALTALFVVVAAAGAVGYKYFYGNRARPFETVTIQQVTDTGKERNAAISPDGTNLVYIRSEDGKASIWLRNLPSGAEKLLHGPLVSNFGPIVFSPKGDSVFFVKSERNEPPALFQQSILDGEPKRLIDRVYYRVTFSPDGSRIAFIRIDSASSQWEIITSRSDGSDERIVARSLPGELIRIPSWSPASNELAAFKMNLEPDAQGNRYSIVEIDVDSGVVTEISRERWFSFGDILWTKDGEGLIFDARRRSGQPSQIWHLDRETGSVRGVTTDTDDYQGITIDQHGRAIAAVKTMRLSGIWVSPGTDLENLDPITTGAASQEGDRGVAFGAGGRILYTSSTAGNWDIWSMNADGSDRRRLTTNEFVDINPIPVPDSEEIIYVAQEPSLKTRIWKMSADGTNKTQLTSGNFYEDYPIVTPDGTWLIYIGPANQKEERVWKLRLSDGEPVLLSESPVRSKLAVSPDSKFLAFATHNSPDSEKHSILIIPLEGGGAIRKLDAPEGFIPNTDLRWSPDGKSITYKASFGPGWNLWSLPIEGRPPRQLTHFENERIYWFDWSPDGRLVLCKGRELSDIVLIKQAN